MRIIDSNKDYYDFYQNIYRDNTFTFDRRDSYDLSKNEFCRNFVLDMRWYRYVRCKDNGERYLLLQICNHFWLMLLTITKTDNYGCCLDYSLELLDEWKDYNRKRELIKFSQIKNYYYGHQNREAFIDAVKHNDYDVRKTFDNFSFYRDNIKEKRHIPILKNIGIAALIKPLNIYLALEEYFAAEKASQERTTSVDLTNDDKVTNHGFDLKSSFRNIK